LTNQVRSDPHDPEKTLRRCGARADDRDAVSQGFQGWQNGAWWLLNTPAKEEISYFHARPPLLIELYVGLAPGLIGTRERGRSKPLGSTSFRDNTDRQVLDYEESAWRTS
jgi:hypothetical protein